MMTILCRTKDKLYIQWPWHFRFTNPSSAPAHPAIWRISNAPVWPAGLLLLLLPPSLLLGFIAKTADVFIGRSVQMPYFKESVRVPEVWIDYFPHSLIQDDEEKIGN